MHVNPSAREFESLIREWIKSEIRRDTILSVIASAHLFAFSKTRILMLMLCSDGCSEKMQHCA